MQVWHWVWSLEPLSRKAKHGDACLESQRWEGQWNPWAPSSLPFLVISWPGKTLVSKNKAEGLQKMTSEVVTSGLHTCNHRWAPTHSHITNNTTLFMTSSMACICYSCLGSTSSCGLALIFSCRLTPAWLVPYLQHGALCLSFIEYSASMSILFW